MFGIYRTTLAIFVVLAHFAKAEPLGAYAVYSFFCLSGFLMTLLMCETYAGRPLDFAINRFLRIYPMYWAVSAATAFFILWRPLPGMIGTHDVMGLPTEVWPLLKQALYAVTANDESRLVPVSWAVSIELIFYALIGLGISATLVRSAAWLVVSASIIGYEFASGYSIWDAYVSPLTASFAFALGSCLYHLNKRIEPVMLMPITVATLVVCGAGQSLLLAAHQGGHMEATIPMLLNCVATGSIVLLLYNVQASKALLHWDAEVGRLSYPIYLSHFLAALIVKSTPPYLSDGWVSVVAILVTTLALSAALVALVDRPTQRIRELVRAIGSHKSRLPQPA